MLGLFFLFFFFLTQIWFYVFCVSSTAKKEDIKLSVRKLLNRHNIVFGDYTWSEFDEPFLTRNVQSVSIVDTELKAKDPQVT